MSNKKASKDLRFLAISDEKLMEHIDFPSFVHVTRYHGCLVWVQQGVQIPWYAGPAMQTEWLAILLADFFDPCSRIHPG